MNIMHIRIEAIALQLNRLASISDARAWCAFQLNSFNSETSNAATLSTASDGNNRQF